MYWGLSSSSDLEDVLEAAVNSMAPWYPYKSASMDLGPNWLASWMAIELAVGNRPEYRMLRDMLFCRGGIAAKRRGGGS